jgi:ABC-2 type transport system permease protein
VLFGIEIPRGFERAVRRGERPALLVAADATDPVASSAVRLALGPIVQTALAHDRMLPASRPRRRSKSAVHARYNPSGSSRLNIVPGLVGTILTMTMLIFTALSVTREIERGTMESLLVHADPPLEIMLGKIIPYVMVGFIQAALIIGFGILLFGVPVLGSCCCWRCCRRCSSRQPVIGYTFSTIAQNQLQAIQMSMMFFLPNILLSGFMFPFAGHAAMGAMDRRGAAAHALSAHRARHHAERLRLCGAGVRRIRIVRSDAGRHDDCGDKIQKDARLITLDS